MLQKINSVAITSNLSASPRNAKKAILAVSLLSSLFLFSHPALPAISQGTVYSQNFDALGQAAATSIPGWTIYSNGVNQSNSIEIINDTAGGFNVGGYLVSGNGSDYGLGTYETGIGKSAYLLFDYIADKTITNITCRYDFESAWSRYDSSKFREAGLSRVFATGLPKVTAHSILQHRG